MYTPKPTIIRLRNSKPILLFVLFSLLGTAWAQDVFDGPITAQGEVLVFGGQVLDRAGNPLSGARVEIWQTDHQGIYDHPGDRRLMSRDQGFQGFGSSMTNSQGLYRFRTLLPGVYGSRPRHIHVKVKHRGRVLLITQIYFTKDGETRGVGGSPEGLYMDLEKRIIGQGHSGFQGGFDFVVDDGTPGSLPLTRRQSEGPFYPRAEVSLFDNDLVSVP
jgi:protocatechuate 3,4-dioxygenase beta subunit